MGKVANLLQIAKAFIVNPKELMVQSYRKALEINYQKECTSLGFGQGIRFVSLLDVCPTFNQQLNNITFLTGTSRVTDFALLKQLVADRPNAEYLEIGSFRGESLNNIAQVANHCTSISLSQAEMRAMGVADWFVTQDGMFINETPNITRILHNSLTLDFSTINKKFDVIFIDGDHTFNGVKSDTQNCFNLLKDDNSVIVWHDSGYFYDDYRWEVLAGILAGTPPQFRNNIYRVTNTLCAIYSPKPIPLVEQGKQNYPAKIFDVTLKAQNL